MPRTNDHSNQTGIKWRHRLSVRLSILFSVFSVLIFGLTLGYNYYQARKMILARMEDQARNIVAAATGRVSTTIASVTAVFGSTVAFEPYPDSRFPTPYAPYFYKIPGGVGYIDLTDSYDYTLQDWYQIPRELKQSEWSEPYFDEGGGNILMSTGSVLPES